MIPTWLSQMLTHLTFDCGPCSIRTQLISAGDSVWSNPVNGAWISEELKNNYENKFDGDWGSIHGLGDFNAIGDQA